MLIMVIGAVLNGALYYYGGRVKTDEDQTDNEWSTYSV